MIKDNPKVGKFRKKPFPLYSSLESLYEGNIVCTSLQFAFALYEYAAYELSGDLNNLLTKLVQSCLVATTLFYVFEPLLPVGLPALLRSIVDAMICYDGCCQFFSSDIVVSFCFQRIL
jgi:hypothetical protein